MDIKVVSYNIDGLPEKIDLRKLPLVLRPIACVYKLFKGTTLVTVNNDSGKAAKIAEIGRRISEAGADILCVQEDFNYHDELVKALPGYRCGTYQGGFDLSKLFSHVKWFPFPRFKADGLNIFVKGMDIISEEIIPWEKSYGYLTHASDKLAMKGFRHYKLCKDTLFLEVYIVHMDADFYDPEKCPDVSKDIAARKAQLQQLTEYILLHRNMNPTLVIGDFNSTEKYEWDREHVNKYFLEPLNDGHGMCVWEITPDNHTDVDRIFCGRGDLHIHSLEERECSFLLGYEGLSDHFPIMGVFEAR